MSQALTPGDGRTPWRSGLPERWPIAPLKSVVDINARKLSEAADSDLSIQYIDISSVDSLGQVGTVETMRFETSPSRARRLPRRGDTIVSTVRTYLRAIAYIEDVPEDDVLVCSTGFAVLSARPALDPKFLFYWMRSNPVVDEICARSVGVSYPAINPSDFSGLPVCVPPRDVQRSIADFLDRKTAAIDALIEKKERLISLLEEKRQALITQAVTKGLDPNVRMKDSGVEWLGKIPAHWDVVSLRRVAELGQGDAFAHALQGKEAGDFPWFKVGDMNRPGNEVEMRTADNYVDSDVAAATRARVFPRGTVIFPRVGAALLTNKRRLLVGPSIVDDNTYGVVPNEHIRPRFLYFVLLLVDMGMFCSAGLVPTVTFSAVKEIVIPLPPAHEQAAIVQRVESELTLIGDLAARTARSIQLLRKYRQAVITAAVTGKLDVTSDEAA